MFKINITKKDGTTWEKNFATYEEAKTHIPNDLGKPEREIPVDSTDFYNIEEYEILQYFQKDVSIQQDGSEMKDFVRVKAEYEISEPIYLEKTYEYQLQKCYEERKKGYGSIEFQMDIQFHQGFDAWKAHIEAVKLANPKPIQE